MASRPLDSARWAIPADPDRVQPLLTEVAGFLEEHGIERGSILVSQLVLEEVVVNVVRHAFGADRSHEVRVGVAIEPRAIELTVEDDGPPFDPTTDAPAADTSSPIEARPEGGMGVHLVKEFTNRLDYARIGRTNRVSMWLTRTLP